MSLPREATLADLFAAQARRTPEAEALVAGTVRWTYRELDRRAGRLARRLQALGVGPEVRVGICLGRSAELLVALLGVLKAGGAYVPLDPAYPEERLRFLLADSAAPVVLSEEPLVGKLAGLGSGARVLCLDREEGAEGPDGEPERRAGSGNLAYLIYTSGSTGRPKGVAIEHRSAVALVDWALRTFPAGERAGMLASTSINFDLSVFELFVPLSSGGKVILAANALELPSLPAASEVTFVNTVPSAMRELVRAGGVPRSVLAVGLAGEPLPRALVEQIHALGTVRRLYNLYGPSEDTTYSTWTAVEPGEDGPPSIGRPVDGTRAWLLDPAGEPVPEGELFLGGEGLARGYLGRPELTAERFVPDPFGDRPGDRLYRTGDLARQRPDGGLDFLGRLDHQVKIRGFRIELGEIETWLGRHPGVGQGLVVAREEREGDRRLVAYVVPRDGADAPPAPPAHELRDYLREKLPEHMVPSAFVRLEAFPLTPNGKIDRKALPAPSAAGLDRGRFVAPRTDLEREMADLWGEVLGLDAGSVGVEDDFFALGGHSLHATRILSRVRDAFGAELAPRRLFEAATVAGLAAALAAAGRADGVPEIPPLTPFPREPRMLPSFSQERLWFLEQLEGGTATYNVPVAMRFRGALDPVILERSVNEVVRRHEALRTALVGMEGRPFQVIAGELHLRVPVTDLTGIPPGEREGTALRGAEELAREPFDLARLPLLRAHLFRLGDEDHLLLLNMHHVVSDDWSLWVFVRELGALYRALSQGEASPLPELRVQYPDYALWQRGWLRGEILARQLDFWRRQLAGAPTSLELPTDRPRPKSLSFRGRRHPFALPDDLARSLAALSRGQGATLFMTLLAAFGAHIGRLSGQDDLLIGFPIAYRNRADVEGLIGFFTNTLVLRVDLSGGPRFQDLLAQVRESAIGAGEHQDLPFESLVAELRIERQRNRNPFFSVMFALQNAPQPPRDVAPGLTLDAREVDTRTSKVDLSLLLWERDEGLEASYEYNTDLFDESTVERLAGHYATLLAGIVADPGRPWPELPLLSEAERGQLLEEWNDTSRPFPRERTIPELFAEQADRWAERVAVELAGERLTYGELKHRAAALSRRLRRLGVGPEVVVGLYAPRSLEMVVGVLGILAAGGAYLPLDASYPVERLAWMLADAGARSVVAAGSLPQGLAGAEITVVPVSGEEAPEPWQEAPILPAQPDNLAYVMYTSGSTGVPKGVGVTHRNVVRLVRGADYARFGAEEVFLHLAPLAFDASTLELWGPLLHGGRLVLMPSGLPSLSSLGAVLRNHGVTTLWLTAGLFHQMVEEQWPDLSGLRQLLAGGDVLSPEHVRRVLRELPGCALINGYGPTENTTFTSCHRVEPGFAGSVPIGRPIANTRVYVVDRWGDPAPLGVAGELYAGGEGLSRGYLSRPALTAERFVPDPWSGRAGDRLYRTGDLVRWRAGGVLEFLGRLDGQVKVRGYRVEPGEVEAALLQQRGVRQAVVVVRGEGAEGKRLVGYVAGEPGAALHAEALRESLRGALPEPLVPAAIVVLDELPLTPNGKVDRQALPAPEPVRGEGEVTARARTPLEEFLAGVWTEVLGLERVGVDDDFFALGGHSLLATRVVSRLRKLLGTDVALRQLFEQPTVAGLARALERHAAGAEVAPPLVAVPRSAAMPLSFAQERLWFLEQLEPGSTVYNIPTALRFGGALDAPALEQSLGEVIRRHEILRSSVTGSENGRPVQAAGPVPRAVLPLVDLSGLPPRARELEAGRLIAADAVRPFDLGESLLRATLLRLDARDHALLLSLHHIAADGWSMRLLMGEMAALYGSALAGTPARLPDLPIQYADFAVWQRQWLQGDVLERQLAYWRETLAGSPPVLDLPADRARPALLSQRGSSRLTVWPGELARGLERMARAEGATLFMAVLAGFQTLLSRASRQEDLTVGTPIAGRNRLEVEPLIGLFVNTLALRTDLSGDPPFRVLLGRVREATLGAYAHQDLPFEKLVQELQPERSLSHTPLFQVFLVLQNTGSRLPALPGLSLREVGAGTGTSKFELTLALEESVAGLDVILEYSTDRFDGTTALRLLEQLRVLLTAAVADPGRPLSSLPLLGTAERSQLLVEWGMGRAQAPRDATLADLFEAQARRTPEAEALVAGADRWSYAELDRRAGQLARRLQNLGVGPEVRVGICLGRSARLLVAILGVLKAGGAYVPLDPAYPEERLRFLVADSASPVVLSEESLLGRLSWIGGGAQVLCLDEEESGEEPSRQPERRAGSGNLAYLIYTSGSTGRPKGVAIEHRSAVALVDWALGSFAAGELAGMLASTSINFDLSVFELFVPLACGGRVILAENALELPALPAAGEVTLVNTVPSAMTELVRLGGVPPSVRSVGLAGEPLPRALAEQIHALGTVRRLYNLYGPSEDTTYSTWTAVAKGEDGPPSIGRPVDGSRVCLLDACLAPVALGWPGELCLGGAGLARGYLGAPHLTAERFVPDPFAEEPGARLYRTGDLARWSPRGSLEFLGRLDHQVKVRGFRIEPGEIEAVLGQHPAVAEVVVAPAAVSGEQRLVAWYVPAGGEAPAPAELRTFLKSCLPEHMVPAHFLDLEALPLTPSGKVDRKALPEPEEGRRGIESAYAPPRSPLEEVVAGFWAEVLGIDRVGIHDNFFELGGHSLLATQVISRVRQVLGADLPLRALFRHPTVASFAAEIRGGEAPRPIPRVPRGGPLPLSFAQERIWFLEQLTPGTAAFNLSPALRLEGHLDVRALGLAFDELVRRHESLRTRFVVADRRPCQVIDPVRPCPLSTVDLEALDPEIRSRQVHRLALEDLWRPFDLAQGPLFRVTLLRLDEESHILLLGLHHAVADGWSIGLMIQEIASLYSALLEGRPSPLPELPVQYADFASWQRQELVDERLESELDHWRRQLGESPAELLLPVDRPRPQIADLRGKRLRLDVPAERLEPLKRLGRRQGATLFMSLVAVLAAQLHRYADAERVHLGTPIANRNRTETEGLIGMFVNTLVLAVDLSAAPTFSGLLERVREVTLVAYEHQDLPYEKLVQALQPDRQISRQGLFQVFFALGNAPVSDARLPDLTFQGFHPEGRDSVVANFDLNILTAEDEGALFGWIAYSTALFDAPTVRRLLEHFQVLLDGAAADPDRPLAELPLLGPAERHQLLWEWSPVHTATFSGLLPPGAEATAAYVLDRGLAPAPIGVMGEVWLGDIARGVALHRTGRRMRYLPDGRLAGEVGAEAPEAAPSVRSEAPAPVRQESRAELEARVSQRRSGLSASKRDLLEQRLRGKASKAPASEASSRIPRRRESGPAPLSFGQERLWFLDRLEPGSPAYNIPVGLRLDGELDLPALAAALTEIRRRHEILRTTFGERDGKPFQAAAEPGEPALPLVDLGDLAADLREAEAGRLAREDAARPFDLARGPLLRTTLLRLGARRHALLLSAHHIVFDAWSSGIFTREMGALYAAFAAGRPSPLAELEIQYADFAAWQLEWLRGGVLQAQLAWWRERLADAPPALELPTDRPRPAVVSPRGAARAATFPLALSRGLRQMAKAEGVTLFMVTLAGFQALLSRHTCQQDVSVGTPVAGRSRLEIEPLIGFFVNTLVLRTDLSGEPSFRDLVGRVREVTLGAYAHQDLPFEMLVQELNPARSLARTPLFQVVFSLQNATAETLTLPGLAVRGMGGGSPTAKFDLTLGLEESEEGLNAVLEHSADLFDGTTAERLLEHLGVLLAAAVESPGSRLSELPLLAPAERDQVVMEWNATRVDYGDSGSIPDLFETQVERSPDQVAVVFEGRSLSYWELDRRANRLAWRLRDLGVGPESLVGVFLERSFEMVVSLLAVLKAGGAYVPLDPEYPRERLEHMLADSGIAVLLSVEPLRSLLPGFEGTWIGLDGEQGADEREGAAPERSLTDASLAYVIYTSGSTGRPKGAMNTHGALRNRLLWMQEAYGLTAEDRVLQKTPFSFDVSVWEFFWPLLTGASLVLARPGGHRVGAYLRELIVEEGITTLHFVPSMLAVFLEEEGLDSCRSLVRVLSSGEALAPETVERFFARLDAELHNLYGPTEAAIDVTAWACSPEAGRTVIPIGRPIANLRIHILEPGLTPAGIGLPGELYIGGQGLARGYLGRPELTAERFVPDPFSLQPGERLYRTGDLARWSRHGEIEFLGRVDFQVKVRGFRIELGEIEAALGRHPGVRESVVVLRPAEQRLVAYVVPAGEPPAAGALRSFLRERLPEYMVPAAFVPLAALPLSPNGKVDRRLLPEPEGARAEGSEPYVAPRTPVEEVVAGIWSEVLGVERIGTRDSFFDLGGHSLLATRVLSRVRRALGLEVPLKTLFEAPTVADFAAALERIGRGGRRPEPPLRPLPRKGSLRLSFAQERLWFLDQLEPGSALYNMPSAFLLEGELDVRALAAACHWIVCRHEVLRTVFPSVNGEPVQVIRAAGEGALPLVDLTSLAAGDRERVARDLVRQEARRPFDLARGPLLRLLLVRLDAGRHVLSATLHHIVSDGWSMQIFERELVALYGAGAAGGPFPLPELPLQYADFAGWQREWLQGEVLASEIGYWRERLAGAPPVLDLPLDRPRPRELGQRGGSRSLDLPESLSRSVGALGRAEAATPFMVLLAGFAALLARSTGRTDIVLGAPVAGRDQLETEPLIGLFVNTLVLRADLSGDPDVRELLRRARETTLGAHAHQDLPFERLVEELQPQRSLAHTPLFQVLLVQAARRVSPGLPGLAVHPFGAETGTAKLDLTLAVSEGEQGLRLALEYRTDLFDATTAERLLAHLAVLLEGAAGDPGRRLSELPVLTAPERTQVVSEWNAMGLALPGEETLAGLFEAQVERTPGAVALVAGTWRWSYRELDREAGRLARRLQSLGVGPEVRVGIHLDRSPELVIALLAVLKAGGAYVPLDPGYPEERLAFLVADSAAAVILSREDRGERLARISPGARVVCLDREPPGEQESGAAERRAGSGHLAYLIYTSGSTGRPKGVAIEHRSAVAMVRWALETFAADDLAGMLASTSINFDLSVFELFVPLSCGGKVLLAGSALDLPSLPAAGEVTFVNTVPSAMAELVRTGGLPPSVTAVGLAGEPLPLSLVRQLYRQGTVGKVYNLYGPSEGTTYSTWALLDREDDRPPSIGRPVANTEIYLLDSGFSPVGIGSPGELYVGGAGVARGYLGRPELTAERFLPDPWSGRPGARLYRTGDLARWRRDGEIDFLGRTDFQVKVRGFRIELGEIEAALDRHPGVREAVVVLADGPVEGDKRLVAYVALAGELLSAAELRAFLEERLPGHMVPPVWVLLDSLPRTPNGKIDRRALPEPDAMAGPEPVSVPPRNPVEEVLAGIWAEVLGRDQVGVTDDFFALGGHSLLATRVIAQVKAAFRVEMGLQSLFKEPTVERMAASLLEAPGDRERIERTAQLLLELAATPDEEIQTLLGEDPAAAGGRHR